MDSVCGEARDDATCGPPISACVLAVGVVLTDEQDRERPRRGQIHRLGEDTGVHHTITEERDSDPIGPSRPHRERCADREADSTTDDAVGTGQAVLDGREVHRFTESTVESLGPGVQLGHNRRRVHVQR